MLDFLVSTDLRNANKKILGQVKVAEEKGSKIFQEALTQQQILDKLVEDAYSVNRTAETAKNLTKGILGYNCPLACSSFP